MLEMEAGRADRSDDEREGSYQHDDVARHMPFRRPRAARPRALAVTGKVDIVPMVEANGSKPISPLSVAAEPHCVSIKELQLGRRSFLIPPKSFVFPTEWPRCGPGSIGCPQRLSDHGQVAACGRLRGASIHRAK